MGARSRRGGRGWCWWRVCSGAAEQRVEAWSMEAGWQPAVPAWSMEAGWQPAVPAWSLEAGWQPAVPRSTSLRSLRARLES
jgi:hypothetical protein